MKQFLPKSEAELVRKFLRLLPSWIPEEGNQWIVAREMPVGRNTADVVAASRALFGETSLRRGLSAAESVLLAALRTSGGASRIDILERRLGVQRHGLRNGFLDALVDLGLVDRQRGGRVAVTTTLAQDVQVYAFEAKLSRWREALQQATQYRLYADLAFVVLPESALAAAIRNIQAFRERGVGLLSVSKSRVTVVADATPSSEHDWRREYVLSRLMGSSPGSPCRMIPSKLYVPPSHPESN